MKCGTAIDKIHVSLLGGFIRKETSCLPLNSDKPELQDLEAKTTQYWTIYKNNIDHKRDCKTII